jgi:acyl CoA:acetate/3-ketoacid CoA transferase beta subunit
VRILKKPKAGFCPPFHLSDGSIFFETKEMFLCDSRVNLIVTDLAVIEVTEKGLLLKEIAPETTLDEVLKYTAASLIVPEKVHTMPVTL